MSWIKNIAVPGFSFGLVDSALGTPITSAEVVGYITKNGGAQAPLVNTPVHKGNGLWVVDLTAAELNAEIVGINFVSPTSVPCYFTIKTTSGGINNVWVTVQYEGTPVPDVDVYVYNELNTVYITNGITNSNGQVFFYLNNGAHSLRLRKSGYTIEGSNELIVSGDTTSTFSITQAPVGVPTDIGACRVYDYCFDQAGAAPLSAVVATAKIKAIPAGDDNLYTIKPVQGIYDATTGLLYWDIVQGATVLFSIPALGVDNIKTIPEQVSALLSNL